MVVSSRALRSEFSDSTKRLVAERAGYRCSFPGCAKLTVGPAADPNKSDNTGIAAHIYGAAVSGNGPRGTGDLSERDLHSPQNSIWLCANHASLIDKRMGADYAAGALHSYKALHETRIAHELAGIHTPFGWVRKFTVHSSPLFADRFEIELAKLNLIVGGNSVGKTALCEWIAGISNPTYLERWEILYPVTLKRLSAQVEYFNPDPHRIEVDFLNTNYPQYKLDGERTFLSTNIVRVVFPESLEIPIQGIHNDRDAIANSIKLHPYELEALCDELSEHSDLFKGAYFKKSDERIYMHVEVQGATKIETRLLRLLASSEHERLMLELGIIAAKKLSMIGPTLLVLDANSWKIDMNWLIRYGESLSSPSCRFQTIVSSRLMDIKFEEVEWSGWKVIRLDGTPPDAVIVTGS